MYRLSVRVVGVKSFYIVFEFIECFHDLPPGGFNAVSKEMNLLTPRLNGIESALLGSLTYQFIPIKIDGLGLKLQVNLVGAVRDDELDAGMASGRTLAPTAIRIGTDRELEPAIVIGRGWIQELL
jgi:hypothetical protein